MIRGGSPSRSPILQKTEPLVVEITRPFPQLTLMGLEQRLTGGAAQAQARVRDPATRTKAARADMKKMRKILYWRVIKRHY